MRNYMVTITRVLLTAAAIFVTADAVLLANPKSLSGVVQTGGTSSSEPLPNVHVTLFEATQALPTTSGARRQQTLRVEFTIPYRNRSSSSIFFVRADIHEGVEFVNVLGPNLPASVTINEITTVAASYSLAQFLRAGVISGNSFGLQIAAGMNDNIVASATGQSSLRAVEFAECRSNKFTAFHTIAREFAGSVRRGSNRHSESVRSDHSSRWSSCHSNIAQALANLARDPGQNVNGIYDVDVAE